MYEALTQQMPVQGQHTVHKMQQRHQTTTAIHAIGTMGQDQPAQNWLFDMQSIRERCATSKRTVSVFELQRMIDQEIISATFAKRREGRTAKAKVQKLNKSNRSDILYESVLCTDRTPATSNSVEPPKRCRRPWLPKLPIFSRMTTWFRDSKRGKFHQTSPI